MMTLVTDIHMRQLDTLPMVQCDQDECGLYSLFDIHLPYKHQPDFTPMRIPHIVAMCMA